MSRVSSFTKNLGILDGGKSWLEYLLGVKDLTFSNPCCRQQTGPKNAVKPANKSDDAKDMGFDHFVG